MAEPPFLTVVTRCCKRLEVLQRNIASLRSQTDQAWQQIFIVDNVGRGLHWANRQFYEHRKRVRGKYVLLLDDDDYLKQGEFIQALRNVVTSNHFPDVIILKTTINGRVYPTKKCWNERYPIRAHIGASCFIVKNEVYQKHVRNFAHSVAGDFYFIKSVFDDGSYSIYWWDFFGAISEKANRGVPGDKIITVPDELCGRT